MPISAMMFTEWHAQGAKVHHNNPLCPTARRIHVRHCQGGTGQLPLCKQCERLGMSYWQRKGVQFAGA